MKYRVYYVNNPKKTRKLYDVQGDISDEDMWTHFLNFDLKLKEEVEDFNGEFIK